MRIDFDKKKKFRQMKTSCGKVYTNKNKCTHKKNKWVL